MTRRIKGDIGAIYLVRKRRKIQVTIANGEVHRITIRLDAEKTQRLIDKLTELCRGLIADMTRIP